VDLAASEAAQRILQLASHCHPSSLQDVVSLWMRDMSKANRKLLSHSGALLSRETRCPVDYVSSEGLRFFDPGNYVYALAFDMLWPKLTAEYNWNNETKGDIMEAFMGLAFEKNKARDMANQKWLEQASILAAYIDEMSYQVWSLSVACGSLSILLWVERVREAIHRPPDKVAESKLTQQRGRWRRHKDAFELIDLCTVYDPVLLDKYLCKEIPKQKLSWTNLVKSD
jgi:hypothetical protein